MQVICPAPRRKIQACQHLSSYCLCLHLDQFISNLYEQTSALNRTRIKLSNASAPTRALILALFATVSAILSNFRLGSSVGIFKHSAPARYIFRNGAWPGYLVLGVTKCLENTHCPIVYRNRVGRCEVHGRTCFRRNSADAERDCCARHLPFPPSILCWPSAGCLGDW